MPSVMPPLETAYGGRKLPWKPTSGVRWRQRTTLRLDNLASTLLFMPEFFDAFRMGAEK
jgi:hypothetical protein